MMLVRLLFACSLIGALAAACGGGDGDGRALTLEEYMQRMEETDGETDRKLSEDVLNAGDPSAEEGGQAYVRVLDDAKERYRNVTPPPLVDAAHDEVREAVDEFGDTLDEAADNAQEGARLSDLLAQEEVISAQERLNDALCAVQQVADANGIAANAGCDERNSEYSTQRRRPLDSKEL